VHGQQNIKFLLMFRYNLPVPFSEGQESKSSVFVDSWPPQMGPMGCPETSVRNYHYSLRNIPEEHSSQKAMCSPKLRYSHLLWHCAITKDYTMRVWPPLFAQILCTHQRCTIFKNITNISKFYEPEGWQEVPFWERTYIRRHLKRFSRPGDLCLGILHGYMFIWGHAVP